MSKLNNNWMRIELRDIRLLFERVQEETNISYVSVVIFCAVDVDSLCTLKILGKLFQAENVQYKVYPVTRFRELEARFAEALTHEKVRLFLMINCGATIDLTLTPLLARPEAELFLFDLHKPVHHANVSSPRIKVIDDGHGGLDKTPEVKMVQELNELYELDLESDGEEREGEERQREGKAKLRLRRDCFERAVHGYYSHNFHSDPSSYSAFRLARDLNRVNNDYIWLAILGMTSLFLDQKLSKESLDRLSQFLQSQVGRLNPQSQSKERGEIMGRKGFQFALLEHWSLYESMLHSSYLMPRLGLWQEQKLTRLLELIHHIGISVDQAKQLFKYMPTDSQKLLDTNIFAAAEKFGLLEVTFLSFARNLDYSASFMAADLVHVLANVLEAPPSPPLPYDQLPAHQLRCFWEAYDLLEAGAKEVAGKMESCKESLRVLMRQARNIMERGHIITTNSLSIANVRGDSEQRLRFQHPSALIRLAQLLMAVLRHQKQGRNSLKPLVANWIAAENQLCLSVGVMDFKNSLGQRFAQVAEKLGFAMDQDSFDANIILFAKEHLSAFIKEISRS